VEISNALAISVQAKPEPQNQDWIESIASLLALESDTFLPLLCGLLVETEQQFFFATLVDCVACVVVHLAAKDIDCLKSLVENGRLLNGDTERLLKYFAFVRSSSHCQRASELIRRFVKPKFVPDSVASSAKATMTEESPNQQHEKSENERQKVE